MGAIVLFLQDGAFDPNDITCTSIALNDTS